jgi:hypothetical protein
MKTYIENGWHGLTAHPLVKTFLTNAAVAKNLN